MSTGNALSTLDVLNATNEIDPAGAESYLLGLQKGDGGFSFNDTLLDSDPDSAFFSLLGLEALNALNVVDPIHVSTYFLNLQDASGGFKYFINASLPDVQTTFDAVLSMAMLNQLPMINATKVANYVMTLQRFDGSFAFNASQDTGTIDATFFAVTTLKILGKLTAYNLNDTFTHLIDHWDGATGGFSPIIGGIPTTVATYEAVLSLDALGHGSSYQYKLTRGFLVNSQNEDGGFGWFPAGSSDPWGCHFAVFALAHLPRVTDIAITDVALSKTIVGQGYSMSINVTAENQGDDVETFNVTTYYNATVFSEGFEGGTFAGWDFYYSTNGAQGGSVPPGTWSSSIVFGASALSGSYSARLFADSDASVAPWRVDAAINRTISRKGATVLKATFKFDQITDPGAALGHAFFYISVINALNTSEFITYGFDNSTLLTPGDISYNVSPGDLVNFEADIAADYFNKHGKALPQEVIILSKVSADHAEPSPGRQTTEVRLDDIALIIPSTPIETKTVTLTSGNSTVITFTWNTAGVAKGVYTISAYATPVSGETDTENNAYTDGWVIVTWLGDFDRDGDIDRVDFWHYCAAFIDYYKIHVKDPLCDFDDDCDIDRTDLWTFCAAFIDYYKAK